MQVFEDTFAICDGNGDPNVSLTFRVDASAQIAALKRTLGAHPLLYTVLADGDVSLDTGALDGHAYHVGCSIGGTGLAVINGGAPTVLGTATGRNVSDTALGRYWRGSTVSAAGAGSVCGYRTGQWVYTGDGARGGFCWLHRFANSDLAVVAGARAFYGMRASAAAPTDVDASTLTNAVGVAQLEGDATQMYWIASGTAAQTPIPLGPLFPPIAGAGIDAAAPYELVVLCTRQGAYHMGLKNLATGQSTTMSVSGDTDATRPGPTTIMALNCYRSNNATALAVGQDLITTTGWNFIA